MKQSLESALFSDCETDEKRAMFFASGRAFATGIVAASVTMDVARAYFAASFVGELTLPLWLRSPTGTAGGAA